ncbi:hypothetical protein BpHYR1_007480 [Brachionus plicatilis]|uniref:Uncharacterized protein n=1 Tax=Brachionus plicatilis TaxID=10195 RepID=A0A3M7R2V2_BRAPC|nr:hypothetical protein BpHYR1_007480 [Brachionus plicatilis]
MTYRITGLFISRPMICHFSVQDREREEGPRVQGLLRFEINQFLMFDKKLLLEYIVNPCQNHRI